MEHRVRDRGNDPPTEAADDKAAAATPAATEHHQASALDALLAGITAAQAPADAVEAQPLDRLRLNVVVRRVASEAQLLPPHWHRWVGGRCLCGSKRGRRLWDGSTRTPAAC